MKKCTKCLQHLEYNNFRKDGSKKDWFYPSCNDCQRKRTWARKMWTFESHLKTHWMTNEKIYKVYRAILDRCNYPSSQAYNYYGWRWIKCEWNNFEEFYADMKDGYEKWLEIDRIDVNWNYCKENCRWVDLITQARNKRNVKKFIYKWKCLTIPEITILYWIKWSTFRNRINVGYSLEEAIETPMHKNSWIKRNKI